MRTVKVNQKELENQTPICNKIEIRISQEGDVYTFYKNGVKLANIHISCYTTGISVFPTKDIELCVFKDVEDTVRVIEG